MDFEVEWTSEAWTELRALVANDRRPVMRAAAALARHAARETRTRRRLRGTLGRTGERIWEVRVSGGHRLRYHVAGSDGTSDRRRAQILRVIVGALTAPAALWPAEARELERRHETLRRIGGGIPHEVVRRAWLAELRRGAP